MPTISRFFGIAIRMYYDDHGQPHFHAYYGSSSVKIDIETLDVIEGTLPRRALGLVMEWAAQYRNELMVDWQLAEEHLPLNAIPPLE
jgi:hypothetical protein